MVQLAFLEPYSLIELSSCAPLSIIPRRTRFVVERFWAATPFKCSTKCCT